MDGSTMRRGKPCWHRLPGVGLSAINDGLILDSAINHILNDTLRNDPNKDAVSNVFAHAKQITAFGQMLDNSTNGLKDCTWERQYTDIVNHKTSYYTCYAPLRIAMLLADCTMFAEQCKQIAFKMGYLFQAQVKNDFCCGRGYLLIAESDRMNVALTHVAVLYVFVTLFASKSYYLLCLP
ncbi:Farnesyl pyrophosphate synthase [Toxocara canis]|uniref:Farnesyl pyrophosphate synthase n=1 Tax=Toxocara canis TaxID=6265 RepID=A0A0B2UPN7_TOXCA|nr:Farnesyl pyrophosphate synthase [Toxocara canis]